MSVFRIFKGGSDEVAEYKGTAIAGEVFGELWTKLRDPLKPGLGHVIKPGQIYEELIYILIKDKGCDVEYNKGDQNYPVDAEVDGKKKAIFYVVDGKKFPIDLKVVRDDNEDDVIYMVVPYKRDVDATSDYLGNAVKSIKNNTNMQKNKEFLFGMLLLKRCR